MTPRLVCTNPYKANGDIRVTCPPCDYSLTGGVYCCRNCPEGPDYGCNSRCGWLEEKGEIKSMITNINVNKISPHHDNPRKDLGDLTELAASIKANGILQNLTVVPWFSYITGVGADDPKQQEEMGYIVVIGHRRLAAAKLAGLMEVPCVIADMDLKAQVATMLLENLQRNDLTIWEQAQGFQLMLNFGETIEDIAGRTGFSESTIRRRVKLLELDKDKFQKSVSRGATLQDYAELDKISDIELKNKVLEKIGTANFKWELQQAIDAEKSAEVRAALIVELEKFATRVEKSDGLRTVEWLNCSSGAKVKKPADAGEKKYFFMVNGTHYIQLLEKYPQSATQTQQGGASAEEQRKLCERRERLDELNKRAYELRSEFVKNYVGRQKDARNIMAFALKAMLTGELDYYDLHNDICEVLGIKIPEPEDEDDCNDDEIMAEAAVFEAFGASPEKVLLVAAYCGMEDKDAKYHDWLCKFKGSEVLDALYGALEQLGYEISEEEHALRDGTHELYVRDQNGLV